MSFSRNTTRLTALAWPQVAALVTLAALMSPPAFAAAQQAPASWRGVTTLCRREATRRVANSSGGTYIIRNAYWGAGDTQCITNRNGWSNFTVTRSTPIGSVGVSGFPFIMAGCSWGACAPHSAFPLRVSATGRLAASWWTAGTSRTRGRWNAAFDIWIMRHPARTGQAHGAEVMIWLTTRGYRSPVGRALVRMDGVRWWFSRHLACANKAALTGCWNFVLFWRVRKADHVSRLRLAPFLRYAERARRVRPDWYVTAVEAGFEIRSGGRGLGTSWFWCGTGRFPAT